MSRQLVASFAVLVLGLAPVASGEEPAAPQTVTLQGEVVDPALYLKEGRHGRDAEELMFDAVEGGQSLALLQGNPETLVLFLAAEPGDDPNALVYDFAGRKVSVTGSLHERGGMKGMVVDNIESLESDAAAPVDEP